MLALPAPSTAFEPDGVTTSVIEATGKPIVLRVPVNEPAFRVGVLIVADVTDADPSSVPLLLWADTVNTLPGVKPSP